VSGLEVLVEFHQNPRHQRELRRVRNLCLFSSGILHLVLSVNAYHQNRRSLYISHVHPG